MEYYDTGEVHTSLPLSDVGVRPVRETPPPLVVTVVGRRTTRRPDTLAPTHDVEVVTGRPRDEGPCAPVGGRVGSPDVIDVKGTPPTVTGTVEAQTVLTPVEGEG